MAKFPGHDLTEVICGFWFVPSEDQWNPTNFETYFEKAKPFGYSEKLQQKDIKVQFNLDPGSPETSSAKGETTANRFVFRNPNEATAILLGPHYISAHKLKPYHNWESFFPATIKPALELFLELGFGKVLAAANVAYINQINVPSGQSISDLLGFIPTSNALKKGNQFNVMFQSQYQFGANLTAQLRLFQIGATEEFSTFTFECSCISVNHSGKSSFEELANLAHDKANEIFNSILK